ncbi:MAG: FIST C-terminal domain-containing protein [candidate division Zixibacteria bacterium]|nr:FIST C-terminal domain-containing protein [candidate division Zixibacteria bacterium]
MTVTSGFSTRDITDVSVGMSVRQDVHAAVEEFSCQVLRPDTALAVAFVSPRYPRDELGPLLQKAFGDCPVIGCTTAGEITPAGYSENSLAGFGISGKHSAIRVFPIESLKNLSPDSIRVIEENTAAWVAFTQQEAPESRAFALFMVDGMSGKEEEVVALIHQAIGNIPLVGGSAGDNLSFDKTWVLINGEFRTDAAILTLVSTTLPFETVKIQHFLPTDTKLVITEADPATRTIYEINGLPAADEYARLIGIEADALVPTVFSQFPIMLKIGDLYYVRSLQKKNADGSLTFYCAIDNGLVLRIGKGVDIVENLENRLNEIADRLPEPQLLITCECVLRRLEVLQKGLSDQINRVLTQHHAIGFHSYGEQFNAIHVNQTFSAVMLGRKS